MALTRKRQTNDPKKEFLAVFKRFTNRHRPLDIWRDFVTMFACSLSNSMDKTHYQEREALYMNVIKKYNKQEQEVFPELAICTVSALEKNQEQDFLGDIFMTLELGNSVSGQFFTPYSISQLMASISMENVIPRVKEVGYISVCDPCCGAGAMLIASVNEARKQLEKEKLCFQYHILVAAQDIDLTAALMCYIQLSLLGVAGYVKVGNSLTDPMRSGDNLENYWFMPMYFSNIWEARRIFKELL